MPIQYTKETSSWDLIDLTKEEQEALVNLGINNLIHTLGMDVAQRIFDQVGIKVAPSLEGIPVEEMGNAN